VYLDGNRIVRIDRVGHCHMCGCQWTHDVLDRFPHRTLEEGAQEVMTEALRRKRKRKRPAVAEPPPAPPGPKLVSCRCLGLAPGKGPYRGLTWQMGSHPTPDCPACHGTGECRPEHLALIPFEPCEPAPE
jgi:hypothetical protein